MYDYAQCAVQWIIITRTRVVSVVARRRRKRREGSTSSTSNRGTKTEEGGDLDECPFIRPSARPSWRGKAKKKGSNREESKEDGREDAQKFPCSAAAEHRQSGEGGKGGGHQQSDRHARNERGCPRQVKVQHTRGRGSSIKNCLHWQQPIPVLCARLEPVIGELLTRTDNNTNSNDGSCYCSAATADVSRKYTRASSVLLFISHLLDCCTLAVIGTSTRGNLTFNNLKINSASSFSSSFFL